MIQPQFAMPTKDSVTEFLQCRVPPCGGDARSRRPAAITEMHFIKAQSVPFVTETNPPEDCPLYCTPLSNTSNLYMRDPPSRKCHF